MLDKLLAYGPSRKATKKPPKSARKTKPKKRRKTA
jgi:hypothetical protein